MARAPKGARRSLRVRQNGYAIRPFREARGLTGVRLAALVGVAHSTLANVERERRSASPELLARVAEALRVRVEALERAQPGPPVD